MVILGLFMGLFILSYYIVIMILSYILLSLNPIFRANLCIIVNRTSLHQHLPQLYDELDS